MGRLPGLDQRGRMGRDGATGSEQGEHPAGLFDDTGPTREDVKSSEEGGLLARLFGQTLVEETFLPLRVYFLATSWRVPSAYGPEAEVRELHTFDATLVLRMTAFAYKRKFRSC